MAVGCVNCPRNSIHWGSDDNRLSLEFHIKAKTSQGEWFRGRRCVARRTQLCQLGPGRKDNNPCSRPGIGRDQRIQGHPKVQSQRGTEANRAVVFGSSCISIQAPGNSGCDGLHSVDIGINGVASWLCVPFGHWRWAQFLAQGPARNAVGRSLCRGRSDPVHRCRQPDV